MVRLDVMKRAIEFAYEDGETVCEDEAILRFELTAEEAELFRPMADHMSQTSTLGGCWYPNRCPICQILKERQ